MENLALKTKIELGIVVHASNHSYQDQENHGLRSALPKVKKIPTIRCWWFTPVNPPRLEGGRISIKGWPQEKCKTLPEK
jgi:hypothetical protein